MDKQAQLFDDIVKAMCASLEAHKYGIEWRDFDDGKWISITTEPSSDPRRSRNGGAYFFYRDYKVMTGGVLAEDTWSCDIQYLNPPDAATFYPVDIADLSQIAQLAEATVMATRKGEAVPVCPYCGRSPAEPTDDQP